MSKDNQDGGSERLFRIDRPIRQLDLTSAMDEFGSALDDLERSLKAAGYGGRDDGEGGRSS